MDSWKKEADRQTNIGESEMREVDANARKAIYAARKERLEMHELEQKVGAPTMSPMDSEVPREKLDYDQ